MRRWHLACLSPAMVLAGILAGCGGGDKSAATLTVTCGGSETVVGARSVDVLGDTINGRPTLSFPDPVNRGKTGAVSVRPQERCTITPVVGSGG